MGSLFTIVAANLVVLAGFVVEATVLPDRPQLAFLLSLAAGTAATMVVARLPAGQG